MPPSSFIYDMKKATKLLLMAFCLVFLVVGPFHLALTLSDGKSGKLKYAAKVKAQERFAIQFIHSIHKTPVYEEYYINERYNLVLDKVIYESYGVGNPSTLEPGQTYKHENGKYIIGNIQRQFSYIDQAIGQVVADHHLKIKDHWVPLSRINPPGSWVRIEIKRVSLLALWKGEWLYGK